MQRVVLDTNAWVSAVISEADLLASLRRVFDEGQVRLLISAPLLAEIDEVLARPRLARRYGVTAEDRADVAAIMHGYGVMVPLAGSVRLCRDPDDDMVLETAIAGQATMLITRDADIYADAAVVDLLAEHGVAVVSLRSLLGSLDG